MQCELTGKCKNKAIFQVLVVGDNDRPQMKMNLCRKCLNELSREIEAVNGRLDVENINERTKTLPEPTLPQPTQTRPSGLRKLLDAPPPLVEGRSA